MDKIIDNGELTIDNYGEAGEWERDRWGGVLEGILGSVRVSEAVWEGIFSRLRFS